MGGFGSKEWVKKRRFSSLENWSFWEIRAKFGQLLKTKNIIISNIYGGSAWESNPPERVLAPHSGFEVYDPGNTGKRRDNERDLNFK